MFKRQYSAADITWAATAGSSIAVWYEHPDNTSALVYGALLFVLIAIPFDMWNEYRDRILARILKGWNRLIASIAPKGRG